MFVCQCWAVTTRQIGAALDNGAASADEVAHRTCASTGCGGCREHLEAVIEDYFAKLDAAALVAA